MLSRLSLDEAHTALMAGGVVVFPTETSYGIGCRATDAEAVERVVEIKGRPKGKPLPILLPSAKELARLQPEAPLLALAKAVWPGPVTLVIPAFPGLATAVTAGTNMVGVRVSKHPVARALVERLGEPLVATSANRSGEPAATSIAECDAAGLEGVAGIIDGGPVTGGTSTVVGLVDGEPLLYREGPVSREEIRRIWSGARE